MTPDVIVVGGGITGLIAADELAAAGRRVTLVEARDRLGGRIDTRRADGLSAPIELGAEFVHGEHVATWEYLRAFELDTYELPEHHERRRNGRPIRFPDVYGALERLLDEAHGDRPLGDVIGQRRAAGDDPELLDAVAAFVQGFHAADLSRIGTAGLRINAEAEEQDGHRQFRLLAGYDGLVRGLAERLAQRGIELRPATVVTRIEWRQGEATVAARRRDGAEARLAAPRAVITLPHGVLRAPPEAEGAVRWAPLPPGWDDARRGIEMGDAERVVLQFDAPWWTDGGAAPSFVHGPGEALPVWWTPLPRSAPILTGWAGGPRGRAVAELDRESLTRCAIDSLARIFGRPAEELAARLVALHHHGWSRDPYSRGGYSYPGVGAAAAQAWLRRPVAGTLFLAGEALAGGRNGTVHGAIEEGRRVARAVLGA